MGCAPMGYLLYNEFMTHNPEDPFFFNRDRFVLSAGHGSMLQYSLLHLCGYDSVQIDDLKQFRQFGSKTPGHPENFETPGVEVTTGGLPGQGMVSYVAPAACLLPLGVPKACEQARAGPLLSAWLVCSCRAAGARYW